MLNLFVGQSGKVLVPAQFNENGKSNMRNQHKIMDRMAAEIRHMARIYFAPIMAVWKTWKHGGGYVHQLLSLYRQSGML